MKLNEEQLGHFNEHGYLVVRNMIGQDLIKPVVAEYESRMRDIVKDWIGDGKLDPKVADLPFKETIMVAYEAGLDYFQPLDISLPPVDITPDTPMHTGPAIFDIMVDEGVLDAVESLIGPEIVSNPIQHVRLKPPSRILTKEENRSHVSHTAWHQDRGVATVDADQTNMVTMWLAISEADEENGCLRVLPDTKDGPLLDHCPQPQMGIPTSLVHENDSKPLIVEGGDAVIFHPLTIHGAGINKSERLRWSFDLRYNRTGEPTGRPLFPDFVARSRKDPSKELRDAQEWARMWSETRTKLNGVTDMVFNRWSQDAPICA